VLYWTNLNLSAFGLKSNIFTDKHADIQILPLLYALNAKNVWKLFILNTSKGINIQIGPHLHWS